MQLDELKIKCQKFSLDLPENSWDKIDRFVQLVREHNDAAGLISPRDLDNIWERHIADSLTILFFEKISPGTECMDFGSGGGFPGIVLAIARPRTRFVLAESIGKKVAFLKVAAVELALSNVEIFHGRAEQCSRRFDLITLRATGPLTKTLHRAVKLLSPGGKVALWAGKKFLDEREYWERFLAKRGATMEIFPYPENWLPGRKWAIAMVSAK